MPLNPGERLGKYEVRGPLGAGGMGEVYRALDAGLGREVAVKILPPDLAGDPERLARFEREARVLASLNHANIATLYGFEKTETTRFLVMELVEGESLAQRLKRGPLPLDDALEIFQQIAEGLEDAHDHGVIHRDLKPGNIMITAGGKVKLLDFGLAKALEGEGGVASDASMSPTITAMATARGEVMGTAYYMSPEQARGKPVDRRTDIWAFGCVLYECITGRMAFGGETISDTIALILQSRPDLEALPSDLPPRITELLHRCFERDARKRLRDIGEARLEIEKVRAGNLAPTLSSGGIPVASGGVETGAVPREGRRSPAKTALALLAGLTVGAAATWFAIQRGGMSGGAAGVSETIRFEIPPPEGLQLSFPTISPDGSTILYYARDMSDPSTVGQGHAFVRRLDEMEARRLDWTEGVNTYVFSPDSRWLAYAVPTSPGAPTSILKKAPLDGSSPPLDLADWGRDWQQALIWTPADEILVMNQTMELIRIPTDGSGPSEPEKLEGIDGLGDLFLRVGLPSPDRVLIGNSSWKGRGFHQEVRLLDLKTLEVRLLLEDGASARWSPTGHLLFTRGTTLYGVKADPVTLEPRGGPVPLLDGLGTGGANAGAAFELSSSGTLIHMPGGRWGAERRLVLVGRDGSVTPWSGDRMAFQESIAVSPDGSRVAVTIMGDDLNFSIWVSEVARPRLRLVAREQGLDCNDARWLPDNLSIVYDCAGNAGEAPGIYRAPTDGTRERELLWAQERRDISGTPEAVSPGGRWLVFRMDNRGSPRAALRLMDLEADDPGASARPLIGETRGAWFAAFSPDGRWLAYIFLADQGREIHVRRFEDDGSVGPAVVAATGQIGEIFWQPTGDPDVFELVYGDYVGGHQAIRVRTRPGLSIGDLRPDLDTVSTRPRITAHSRLPDGRHLGVQVGPVEEASLKVVAVVNFQKELRRLMEAAR